MRRLTLVIMSLSAAAIVACGPTPAEKPTPDGDLVAVAPRARPCPDPDPYNACLADTYELEDNFVAALAGDYDAQRNTAYAFSGASPYVESEPMQACAWRIAIMQVRPADARYADEEQLDLECSRISQEQMRQAEALALQIISMIEAQT